MKLDNNIYNKLFSYAKFLTMDEDVAADAVATVFIKIDEYKGSTYKQFYTWANTILHNKKVDYWRKKARNKEVSYDDLNTNQSAFYHDRPYEALNAWTDLCEQQDEIGPDEKLQNLIDSQMITQEEIEYAINYFNSNKLPTDRVNFSRFVKKIQKRIKRTIVKKNYIILDGAEIEVEFKNMSECAVHLGCTVEYVRLMLKNGCLYKKRWSVIRK